MILLLMVHRNESQSIKFFLRSMPPDSPRQCFIQLPPKFQILDRTLEVVCEVCTNFILQVCGGLATKFLVISFLHSSSQPSQASKIFDLGVCLGNTVLISCVYGSHFFCQQTAWQQTVQQQQDYGRTQVMMFVHGILSTDTDACAYVQCVLEHVWLCVCVWVVMYISVSACACMWVGPCICVGVWERGDDVCVCVCVCVCAQNSKW